jgi:hypothetical protein
MANDPAQDKALEEAADFTREIARATSAQSRDLLK